MVWLFFFGVSRGQGIITGSPCAGTVPYEITGNPWLLHGFLVEENPQSSDFQALLISPLYEWVIYGYPHI